MKYAPIVVISTRTAASVNSAAIPAQDLLYCSAQMVATGSAAGTFKLQASNDNPVSGTGAVPTNWSDIALATVTVSGAGVSMIPVTSLCYQWIRVVYTNSGTGTISGLLKVTGF